MKKLLLAWAFLLAASLSHADSGAGIESGFYNPPAQARPHTYWFWMNGNITREGITADLEAMSRVGIGGVLIMNVAGPVHKTDIPPGPVDYLSPDWLEMVKFAAQEAKRLDLKINLHNCAGWATMGGPWIPAEHSMQILVSSEIVFWGNETVRKILPHPEFREDHYRDIAVFALPQKLETGYRVPQWEQKAGQRGGRNGRQPDLNPAPDGKAIPLDAIVDLTGHVDERGVLTWDAPPGVWKVIRLGHTSKGRTNVPAPVAGRGLEVDKLKRQGVDLQWQKGIKPIIKHLGPLAGEVVNTLHIDSYEAGLAHWTPDMAAEFRKRRGYDPTPYLLALTGRLMEDAPTTDRFLWDFRMTLSELYTDHFYGHFADLCHENGMRFSTEPYTSCFEGLSVAAKADLPMAEFFADGSYSFSVELAASAAHVNGRPIAGAEAFTAGPGLGGQWRSHPGSHKRLGDLIWTRGINRFTFHCYAHQPWLDKVPGMTMGQYGCHFDRNNTWWEQGKAWMQYITRSQFLLQHGAPASDVLAYAGQAAPNRVAHLEGLKEAGHAYDSCGTDLFPKLRVEDGLIVLPTGNRYRLLVLPDHAFHTPAIARKLREFVRAGATIVGPKPMHTPSLENFPASEEEVRAIGEDVWGKCDGVKVKSNSFGKGRVFNGVSPAEVLAKLDIAPAVQLPEGTAWVHRHTVEADLFLVSNQTDAAIRTVAGFRAAGKVPELWDAETGTIRRADGWKTTGKHVQVSLSLDAEKSVFVVFRKSGKPASPPVVREWGEKPLPLTGPWHLSFQANRGAPATATFDQLLPWNEHSDPGIKYFSGTATNAIRFDLPKEFLKNNEEVWLDLGQVAVLAEVRLNGKDLGVLWHKPFRVEVSGALKPETNKLEVDVTNLWINRLIGDEQHPPDLERTDSYLARWPEWLLQGKPRPSKQRVTFTTWKHWNADDPLVPSGLIGPVTLRPARLVEVDPSTWKTRR